MPKIDPTVDGAQKFLSELMLSHPGGMGKETDETLAAAVATYLELRAIQKGHKFERELKLFSEGVQAFFDEA